MYVCVRIGVGQSIKRNACASTKGGSVTGIFTFITTPSHDYSRNPLNPNSTQQYNCEKRTKIDRGTIATNTHPRTKPNSSSGSILSFDKCTGYLDVAVRGMYFPGFMERWFRWKSYFITEENSLRNRQNVYLKLSFCQLAKLLIPITRPSEQSAPPQHPSRTLAGCCPAHRLDCDRGISLR